MSATPFLLIDPHAVKHSDRVRPDDGVPLAMCWNCGLKGRHAKPGDCIDALRSVIADLEFQASLKGGTQGAGKDRTMRKYILTADCPAERLDNIGRGIGYATLPEGTRFTIEAVKSRVPGYPLDRE
jgi:hypothetical protein